MDEKLATRSSRQTVLHAITTICEHREAASKSQIIAMTGLKQQIVDEHVKNLRESDAVRMPVAGFYEPVDKDPQRAVSATILTNGRYKVEIGDDVMDLSPREGFSLAKLMAGLMLAFRTGT